MEFLNSQVLQINFTNAENDLFTPAVMTQDVKTFLENIVGESSIENNDEKNFKFASSDVEMSSIAIDIFHTKDNDEHGKSIFDRNVTKIIERFTRIEKKVDDRESLYKLKNCSFIVSYLKYENKFILFVGKFEPDEYYEKKSFKKSTGFSTKKNQRYYKIALISFNINENNKVETQVQVLETSTSKYWTDDFLEATELTKNEPNTIRSFKYLDNVLSKNFQKEYPQDYREMRNTLISEFRNNSEFKLNPFIDKIFSIQEPNCPLEKIANVKDQIIKKFNDKKYDKNFTIVQGVIKNRMSKKYIVNDNVTITNHTGLNNSITLKKNDNGDDVIEILVTNEQTINAFRK